MGKLSCEAPPVGNRPKGPSDRQGARTKRENGHRRPVGPSGKQRVLILCPDFNAKDVMQRDFPLWELLGSIHLPNSVTLPPLADQTARGSRFQFFNSTVITGIFHSITSTKYRQLGWYCEDPPTHLSHLDKWKTACTGRQPTFPNRTMESEFRISLKL